VVRPVAAPAFGSFVRVDAALDALHLATLTPYPFVADNRYGRDPPSSRNADPEGSCPGFAPALLRQRAGALSRSPSARRAQSREWDRQECGVRR
jgi:hypothetical protein